ncbi:cytochrome C-type biogenesis protein [Escherichia coli]|uniref:Cytochrome C-type biogenesis protein n=1 Tax=Escherichia coli TaxID=562 RepID=A0A377K3L7_ECOLX|nr:cytochrome C-type biogenesis protein [Escherichia coli]
MKSGDSVDIHEYRFTFRDVKEVTGPNWRGGVATIGVTRDGKPERVLYAEKRYYNTAGSMMTEAAIDGGITRDLYAALGEELENGAWAVRPLLQTVCSLDLGGRADDGIGRAAVPV